MGKKVYHQEMTFSDFKEGGFDKAVIAVGSAENHGFHLPFGSDTLVSQALAMEVAQRVKGMMVLPPINYGMSRHYDDFQFTLSLEHETVTAVLRDVLVSTIRQGITRIIVVNGHDGNIAPIEAAARTVKNSHPHVFLASLDAWWNKMEELLPPDTFEVWGGLGHAGEGETSIVCHLFPQFTRMENARGVVPDLPEGPEIKWRFNELTPYGATGDPSRASAEKGKKMFDALVEYLVSFVQFMEEKGWNYALSARS